MLNVIEEKTAVQYRVEGEPVTESKFLHDLEDACWEQADRHIDDYIDQSEEENEIEIMGIHFSRSEILRQCDPTAYKTVRNDLSDEYFEEAKDDFDKGIESLTVNGTDFEKLDLDLPTELECNLDDLGLTDPEDDEDAFAELTADYEEDEAAMEFLQTMLVEFLEDKYGCFIDSIADIEVDLENNKVKVTGILFSDVEYED